MSPTTPADATPFLPDDRHLDSLRGVGGSSRPRRRAAGDQEDQQGQPFVGPAGQLIDRAIEEAGIDRDTAYLTNAVAADLVR